MKRFLKITSLAVVVALLATIVSGFVPTPAVFAHSDFPSNIADWDSEDWDRFNNWMWNESKKEEERQRQERERQNRPADGWYNGRYFYYDNGSGSWYFIGEDGRSYSCNSPYDYGYNYNYNSNYNYNAYSGYNFGSGILNVYDGASEYQAQVLAKIMNLYAHGVASQTQQACVAWTVMNSVDSSPGNDIGSIAPLFHYDANRPTTDDFGRDLMPLARDVILRWKAGRAGITNNGRVLPSGYVYVWSNGSTVSFRNNGDANSPAWGYSLTTPYGN